MGNHSEAAALNSLRTPISAISIPELSTTAPNENPFFKVINYNNLFFLKAAQLK